MTETAYSLSAPVHENSGERLDRNQASLRRLFVLRNLVLLAILAVLVVSIGILDLSLPVFPLGLVLSGMSILNLLTWFWLQTEKPVHEPALFLHLIMDVLAFTLLLYFTGGATNPFGWFYLVLVFFAATALSALSTWLITLLAVIGYSLVMFYFQALDTTQADPHAHHHAGDGFQMHVMGMWLGFVVTATLVAYVLGRLTRNLRERDQRLAFAREQALRDEKLVALGTLAAGAAHELGTPLATIAILARELELDLADLGDEQLEERLQILRSQVQRCKQALSVISDSAGEKQALAGSAMSAVRYVNRVIDQWRAQRGDVELDINLGISEDDGLLLAEQTLTQALHSALNNAADASPQGVHLDVQKQHQRLVLEICDEGQGLDESVARHAGQRRISTKENGMGLGLFLAHAAIQRLGGVITLHNLEQGGACTRISLPLIDAEEEVKHA